MSDVIEQVDFRLLEDQLESTTCRSQLKHHVDPHDADWWAVAPCLDATPVCERRRRQCFAQGGWMCVLLDGSGCSAWHDYSHIRFTPVRGS